MSLPPPPSYNQNQWDGTWKHQWDVEQILEYLRLIGKYNCFAGCLIKFFVPLDPDGTIAYEEIRAKEQKDTFVFLTRRKDGELSFQFRFDEETTVDAEYGRCKVLVTKVVKGNSERDTSRPKSCSVSDAIPSIR